MYTIYGLVDPRDWSIFYVGMTKDMQSRMAAHAGMYGGNTLLVAKVDSLLRDNLLFHVEEYDYANDETTAREKEKYWISHWQEEEEPLVNIVLNSERRRLIEYQQKNQRVTSKGQAVMRAILAYGIDDILLDLPDYARQIHVDERTFRRWLQRFSFL